ncbi:hypothetical protein ACIQ1D_22855 [Lysinibacillus xylanilyticus]|uniref:hypothetical protein n=1 Tax=Lysinibacillus xylanilyticus TaxID=582475 RepID=UPI00381589A1
MFESIFVNDGIIHALSVIIPIFAVVLLLVFGLKFLEEIITSILSIPFIKFGILAFILIIAFKTWV